MVVVGNMRNKGQFSKQYTEANIIKTLQAEPHGLMLSGVRERLSCSEQTARNLITPLVESGQVIKRNLGTEKKPVNVFILKS